VSIVRYLTHPQVHVDPSVAVPDWGLSEIGSRRVAAAAASPVLAETRIVVSSAERKAVETATPFAKALGLMATIRPHMHENDRSATGFLPPDEFERVADQFFNRPEDSVRGWERAIDAQRRIVGAMHTVVREAPHGDILLVGHGGVGTLLYCHCAGLAIDRRHDQPPGGGSVFSFARGTGSVIHAWKPMEQALST